jgi:aspartyl-tRNA(Asn)/glutamyl-tRNA(Gln) amidotransferase subunit A
VAARAVPLALGTDTGGSVRQPASFCGLVGLKPTYGRVSRYGLVAFASSLDQAGPLARTVDDAALAFSAMAGADPNDATSLGTPVPDVGSRVGLEVGRLRVGLLAEAEAPEGGLHPDVGACLHEVAGWLGAVGVLTRTVSVPRVAFAVPVYYLSATAEASSNLARFDGVRYGFRCTDPEDLTDLYERTRGEGFGPEVKRRIMIGTYALSAGYYDAYYGRAQRVRTMVRRDFDKAFAEVDLIASPTSPTVAFKAGSRTADPLAMYVSDICTIPANLAGLPAISIPCGLSDGLPVGFQLIGPAFSENRMLEAAHAIEGAVGFDPAPPFTDPGVRPEAEGWTPGEITYRPEDAQS